MKLFILNLQ